MLNLWKQQCKRIPAKWAKNPFAASFSEVKTIEEVRQYWNKNSESYLCQDSGANGFYFSLVNMLKIENRKNILEVGAGGGFLYDHTLHRKRKDAKYVATDLSEGMLTQLSQRIGVTYQPGKPTECAPLNLTIMSANGENLNEFKDNQFDCYIASLCLQITPEPKKMIAEAFRVLQPGGAAGFAVWGDKFRSRFITTVPSVLSKQFGIELPKVRSNFHLNDKKALIELMQEAGFSQIIAWNQFSPYPYSDSQDIDTLFQIPFIQEQLKLAGSKTEDAKKALRQKFEDILFKDHEPIGLDGLLVIGKKM